MKGSQTALSNMGQILTSLLMQSPSGVNRLSAWLGSRRFNCKYKHELCSTV